EAIASRERARPEDITLQDGVFCVGERRCGTYWSLRRHVELEVPVAVHPAAADLGDPLSSGSGEVNLGLRELVRGAPVFIHDKPLDGGLHGCILRPPSIGARLVELDASGLQPAGLRCRVVRDGSMVGVLAPSEHVARKAVQMLAARAVWEEADGLPTQDALDAWLRSQPSEVRTQRKEASIAPPVGKVRTFVADCFKPFLKHASIGPSCAYAKVLPEGGMQVWTHSQGIYNLRADLAVAFGIDPEAVVVEHVPGSGCYGHNGADD